MFGHFIEHRSIAVKRTHVWTTIIYIKKYSTIIIYGGRTGLVVRASDSGSGDPGSILGRIGVVSLSKRHLLFKSTSNTQE